MSEIDELCAILDERGVEWKKDEPVLRVFWGEQVDPFHDRTVFNAVENALPNGGLNVHICGFTAAQAVEATLGRGKCKNVSENLRRFECSECGGISLEIAPEYCPICGREGGAAMSEAEDVLQSIDQLRRDLSGYHGQLKAHNDLKKHCENQRKRICELEGLYEKAKAENDETATAFSKEHDRAEFLMRKNAKQRELIKAAWRCIHTGLSCSDCRLIAGGCTLQSAMRELGIEV